MLSRFYLIPERYGQTDGRTDRIAISISRVNVLTRDKHLATDTFSNNFKTYDPILTIYGT